GQLAAGARAFHLQLPAGDVELVDGPLQDPDEDHVLAARMLQVLQPGYHLARVQTVSAAGVLLTGAFRERFGLLLGVPKRQSTRGGDAVDENCRVAIKISERAAHRLIVRLAVTGDRRE